MIVGGKKMKVTNYINIQKYNSQYERIHKGLYVDMFLQDFYYFLRDRHADKLITYSKAAKERIINIDPDEYNNHFTDIINSSLKELLLEGKAYLILLKYDNIKDAQIIDEKIMCNNLLLYNAYTDKNKKPKYCQIFNKLFSLDKICKKQLVKLNLNEIYLDRKTFVKPLSVLDENHNVIMDLSFIYRNIDHKKVYSAYDVNQIILTSDFYWDCRKHSNNCISTPYIYYRKEKFYNIRVKIFKYIVKKINECISELLNLEGNYINVSEKICELNLYKKYEDNEITLKELQEELYNNIVI